MMNAAMNGVANVDSVSALRLTPPTRMLESVQAR